MENTELEWETESRIGNCSNRHQGPYKRVLAVCSAGMLRSPTIALTLSQPPYNYNTRAAGIEDSYALMKVDRVLLEWADEIVCADDEHQYFIKCKLNEAQITKTIVNLKIPDRYAYRDPKMIKLIKERYNAHLDNENDVSKDSKP